MADGYIEIYLKHMINLLGNCLNTNAYEYSKEDVKKIFGAIKEELKADKSRFDLTDTSDKKFKLR